MNPIAPLCVGHVLVDRIAVEFWPRSNKDAYWIKAWHAFVSVSMALDMVGLKEESESLKWLSAVTELRVEDHGVK